jgi:hypothetical protein
LICAGVDVDEAGTVGAQYLASRDENREEDEKLFSGQWYRYQTSIVGEEGGRTIRCQSSMAKPFVSFSPS